MNVRDFALWTAIVTPMNDDGSVDYESFETLLKEQEKNSLGLVVLGSTGEGLALGLDDKKAVIKYACELGLEVPIVVGVAGHNLEATLGWLDYCEGLALHGYLMPTPLYAKPGPIGQYEWFKALLDKVTRPCMLYNVPSRTGKDLLMEPLEKLKDHENFWALKEASGSVDTFKAYRQLLETQMMMSGDDALTPDFAKHGCNGLVSVASNVWPAQTKRFLEKSLENELSGKDRKLWDRAVDELFSVSNPIPAKVLLKLNNKIKSATLRAPLTDKELQNFDSLLEADKKIKEWS